MKFEITNGKITKYPSGDPRGYYIAALMNRNESDIIDFLINLRDQVINGTGDKVFGIEGPTDSGKTTLSNLLAYIFTLGTFNPKTDICTDLVTLVKRINCAKRGDYIAFEEAHGILTAGTGKALKLLVDLIKVCRTKGIILAIITPKFMDLKKYIVIDRSLFLLRTYFRDRKKKTGKGNFVWYDEAQKQMLYDKFQKKISNIYRDTPYSFLGRFGDFDLYPRDEFKEGIMNEYERRAVEIEGKGFKTKDVDEMHKLKYKLSILYDEFKDKKFPLKRDFYEYMGYSADAFNLWRKAYREEPKSSINHRESPNNSLENEGNEPF